MNEVDRAIGRWNLLTRELEDTMQEGREAGHGTLENAFRETTLRRFTADEQAALRRFGHLLLELALEGHRVGAEEVPLIPSEIGAVGADLEYLAVYLREVSGHLDHSQVNAEEAELCLGARGWADELEGMARRMRRAADDGARACAGG